MYFQRNGASRNIQKFLNITFPNRLDTKLTSKITRFNILRFFPLRTLKITISLTYIKLLSPK